MDQTHEKIEKVKKLVDTFEFGIELTKFHGYEDYYLNALDLMNFLKELREIINYEKEEQPTGGVKVCITPLY